ncbi:putative inorganic diphosphatase [Helianthus anomalus]
MRDRMMNALHAQGKTINDFVDRLNKFTIDPQMISAIRSAHELGYLVMLISSSLKQG